MHPPQHLQTSAQLHHSKVVQFTQRSNTTHDSQRPRSAQQGIRTRTMASDRSGLGDSWKLDADKPWYHVMPRSGWLNDPNGPIFYQGRYHVYYQHIEGTSQWEWRMTWGHASSSDLVHWKHEPIAINPTKGGCDASGCWSGTTVLDTDGTPTMIYTGVRRRDNKDCGPLPHAAVDLGLDMIECQMMARCQQGDKDLIRWHKQEQPIIPHPPDNMKLTGFRDPYIIQQGGPNQKWKMLLGSGIEGQGGTLLLYEATHLISGWQFVGSFINGKSKPLGDHDVGAMWECPFLTPLQEPHGDAQGSSEAVGNTAGPQTLREDLQYVMCVSPYPHHLKDRLTNPCLYWLGHLQEGRFMIAESDGPHLLDLGDVLYAPNCFQDGQGRSIMLAWLQELRQGGGFDYAGCLSLPRLLSYKNGKMQQQAAPELRALQQEPSWTASDLQVSSGQSVAVQHVRGPSWFAGFTLRRGDASASGLLLRSWLYSGPEVGQACAAALLIDWNMSQLQVVFPTKLDKRNMTFDASADMKRIGGPIPLESAEQQVTVQVYADHSAVEVFLSSGEALATRIYRGAVTPDEDPGLFFTSHQGSTVVSNVHVSAMGTIWTKAGDQPAKAFEPAVSK